MICASSYTTSLFQVINSVMSMTLCPHVSIASSSMTTNSPDGLENRGMPAHAMVVIAAPHGDVLLSVGVLLSMWEVRGRSHHLAESTVGVVPLLLLQFLGEELLKVEPNA